MGDLQRYVRLGKGGGAVDGKHWRGLETCEVIAEEVGLDRGIIVVAEHEEGKTAGKRWEMDRWTEESVANSVIIWGGAIVGE